jgi:3-deoxy-D-manno-octulosonate 8-phosphate phosphatase (KDO 8-P phosphatase)
MNNLRAIALDVDGVLTDGGVWWGPDGAEWKRFCFADIMGVSLARKAGLIVTLISGEDSPLVDRFAAKLEIADVTKGCKDKAAALQAFAGRHALRLEEICFMGDDVNDLAAMDLAGFSAAPADARPAALHKADLVTHAGGGNGAVRELVDLILSGQAILPCSRLSGGSHAHREKATAG